MRDVDAKYTLRYVCRYCGEVVATFPAVPAVEPATFSVCDKRPCREQASAAWRAALGRGR
jgi:hypothetical protein